MKKQNLFSRIFLTLSAAALLASCTEIASPDSSASIAFNKSSLAITDALSNVTSAQLSVSLTGNSSDICFKSYDTDVVTVEKLSSNTVSVIAAGDGSTKISAYTEDNALIAYCTVTVTLGTIACGNLSDFAVTSTTVESASLTWTAPSSAGSVEVTATSTADDTDTVSQYFTASDNAGVLEGLSPSTEYSFTARAVNNPGSTKEYASDYTDAVTATTQADITAPASVTVTSTVTDHTIKLTWTEPSDSDYAGVNITPADGSQTYDGTALEAVEYEKGQKTITYSKVMASTEYVFTFATKDKYGNIQGDSNNADASLTVTVTTADDETSPDAVTDVYITVNDLNAEITYAVPDNEDARTVVVECNSIKVVENSIDLTSGSFTLSSGDNEVSVYVLDYDSNKSQVVTAVFQTSGGESPYVSTPVLDAMTGQYSFTVNSCSDGVSYQLIATNTSDASDKVYSDTFVGMVDSIKLTELKSDASYSVEIAGSSVINGVTILYKSTSLDIVEVTTPKTELWAIIQPWSKQRVVPFKTSEVEYANVIINASPDNFVYPYWIMHPASSDDSSKFYLEAADSEGNGSGLYLYFATTLIGTANYNSGNNSWGYTDSAHTYKSMYVSADIIGDNTNFAMFQLGTKTMDISGSYAQPSATAGYEDYCDWTNMNLVGAPDYNLYSNNYNVSMDSDIGTTNGDWAVSYKVIE
ncbi:fibronectin type III domain-containing protein [Treponema sp.]|uniref:fibronectin type III domain-containing protein n=1 Tax=Treponema sp. TaxID=166 RepID=UPI0025E6BD48|nr:fibronectin type III domain-containing protein [Treponema sp.]MCR5219340.1 fibronectin type III domain-containing protein [Treponema sp.]